MAGAWTRSEGKNPEGGLNAKGRASAKAEGHNLKPPVSSEQAERSPAAAQRTSAKTAHDPNSRINLALKKWDVKC